MGRTVYVNGEYVDEADAKLSVFDRGFLFADGVYEVSTVLQGKLIENEAHLARLQRSLKELQIPMPGSVDELLEAQLETVAQNNLEEGVLYFQVTRGAADRDFVFPKDAQPSLVMFTQAKNLLNDPVADKGIPVISVPDIRWRRRDIKSVGLLPAALAKQAAVDAGAKDAWLVEDGYVTEGSSNNAYIVSANGDIVTRQLSNDILHGITRASVLKLAEENNVKVIEKAFTIEEAQGAAEAFITSASTFVYPVTSIDGVTLGDGTPGPVSKRLRELYIQMALDSIN